MKQFKVYKTAILIIAAIALYGFSIDNEKHIGEWKGESRGQIGSLILHKTSYAVFVIGNQAIGGENFTFQSGRKGECKYEIDYSKNPIWLDIVLYESGKSKEIGRLKGIVRFLTDNKMEYRVNFEGDRFENFDSEDKVNTIVLDRVTK